MVWCNVGIALIISLYSLNGKGYEYVRLIVLKLRFYSGLSCGKTLSISKFMELKGYVKKILRP